MFRLVLLLTLLFPWQCFAQGDTSAVKFDDVFKLRCPGPKTIDSMITWLKGVPGTKLRPDCLRTHDTLVERYRREDAKQWEKLRNQARSYAAGWREKEPGRCTAGGPPPICPRDHWYKADIAAAMKEFYSIHEEVRKRRQDEICLKLQSCLSGRPLKVISDSQPAALERKDEPGELRVIQLK
jgi:hypothetical protein